MIKVLRTCELKGFYSYLVELEVKSRCFNLYSTYKKYLMNNFGYSRLSADSIVSRSHNKIEKVLHEAISVFEIAGLPSPYYIDDYETVRNYNHHLNCADINWDEYKKILPLFDTPEPIEFLLLCAAAIYSDGASKVILVDGTNDGGIDIISVLNHGSLEQRVVFVQSKKAINGVGKEIFIYEDAYFKDQALRTNKHNDYLSMLDVNPKDISNDISYCFCTNRKITDYSADYAKRHMIKVRVGRNLAASISRKYDIISLGNWLHRELKGATPKTMRDKTLQPL